MLPCSFGLFWPSFELSLRKKEERRKKKEHLCLLDLSASPQVKSTNKFEENTIARFKSVVSNVPIAFDGPGIGKPNRDFLLNPVIHPSRPPFLTSLSRQTVGFRCQKEFTQKTGRAGGGGGLIDRTADLAFQTSLI